jgi:hypothetical protein
MKTICATLSLGLGTLPEVAGMGVEEAMAIVYSNEYVINTQPLKYNKKATGRAF